MFIDVETEMRGLNWGALYECFHANAYHPNDAHDKLMVLYADYFVKNRKDVFEYILGGCTDTKLLDIRIFDDVTKEQFMNGKQRTQRQGVFQTVRFAPLTAATTSSVSIS